MSTRSLAKILPTCLFIGPTPVRKSFLINLFFAVAINLVVKPLYLFGVEVNVQNSLGAEMYGLYFALFNSAFLLQIINDFGIQIFNNRQIAIDRSKLSFLFSGFLVLKLALGGAYMLLLYSFAVIVGFKAHLPLLLVIGGNMILTSFILFVRSGISGLGYYRIDSVLSVLDKFFMLVILGGLLMALRQGEFTLYHFVFGQTLALILTLVIALFFLRRYSSSLSLSGFVPRQLLSLLRKALPYAFVVFLMTLYTRLDGVMIARLLDDGKYEAGVYAGGYRILDALNMVAFLFAALLLPMFSEAHSTPARLKQLMDEGFRYVWILVVPVTVFGILYRNELMIMLYDQADAYWGGVFAVLLSTFILMGLMYVFGTQLTAAGRVGAMNVVFVVTVLLNILLNFMLIPHYKALGAAIATLITQFIAVGGIVLLSGRITSWTMSSGQLFRSAGFLVFCLLLGMGLSWFGVDRWYWALCVYFPCVVLAVFLFQMLRWSEFISLYKNT